MTLGWILFIHQVQGEIMIMSATTMQHTLKLEECSTRYAI